MDLTHPLVPEWCRALTRAEPLELEPVSCAMLGLLAPSAKVAKPIYPSKVCVYLTYHMYMMYIIVIYSNIEYAIITCTQSGIWSMTVWGVFGNLPRFATLNLPFCTVTFGIGM